MRVLDLDGGGAAQGDWAAFLGEEQLGALEDDLRRVTTGAPGRLLDIPGGSSAGSYNSRS